eukprot:g41374.t1
MVLSAYIDDVLLTFTNSADLGRVSECETVYLVASSTRINGAKCSGILVGPWRVDLLLEELQGFSWSTYHLLYLGIYLSPVEEPWPANWQELEAKVSFRLGVCDLNYDMQLLFIDCEGLSIALRMLPVIYQELINVWNMVDLHQAYPPSGIAAIVRELLLRNPHLHHHSFEWLVEGTVMAAGVTTVKDVLG